MKKVIIVLSVMILLACAYAAGGRAGYTAGIDHAMNDSIIYTVECYDPNNPDENARPDGTDQTIYIEIDGTTYEHGMYQG